jgi:hypothetical protein
VTIDKWVAAIKADTSNATIEQKVVKNKPAEAFDFCYIGNDYTTKVTDWAKNDPSVLPEQATALYNIVAESNPRAWLLFTNRGGHFHYREHPDEWNRNVTNFVTAWGN